MMMVFTDLIEWYGLVVLVLLRTLSDADALLCLRLGESGEARQVTASHQDTRSVKVTVKQDEKLRGLW